MSPDIHHDAGARRFRTTIDGEPCGLEYRLANGIMTISHTRVPAAVGGRGVAAALTLAALQTARREGWKVVPGCSYASAYICRHPEFADLLA
ncbi:MAG: GNAT family N-acetyltransferase [Rhodanobacteraceae bacterium]